MDHEFLHQNAIRLLDGGAVEVDGYTVMLEGAYYLADPCNVCEVYSICHKYSDMYYLCMECDFVSGKDCVLKFSPNK